MNSTYRPCPKTLEAPGAAGADRTGCDELKMDLEVELDGSSAARLAGRIAEEYYASKRFTDKP
jgi:hypothetical protein